MKNLDVEPLWKELWEVLKKIILPEGPAKKILLL